MVLFLPSRNFSAFNLKALRLSISGVGKVGTSIRRERFPYCRDNGAIHHCHCKVLRRYIQLRTFPYARDRPRCDFMQFQWVFVAIFLEVEVWHRHERTNGNMMKYVFDRVCLYHIYIYMTTAPIYMGVTNFVLYRGYNL